MLLCIFPAGWEHMGMHVQIHVHAVSVTDVIATHTCTPEIIWIICRKDASNALCRLPSACTETPLAPSAATSSIPLKEHGPVGLQWSKHRPASSCNRSSCSTDKPWEAKLLLMLNSQAFGVSDWKKEVKMNTNHLYDWPKQIYCEILGNTMKMWLLFPQTVQLCLPPITLIQSLSGFCSIAHVKPSPLWGKQGPYNFSRLFTLL